MKHLLILLFVFTLQNKALSKDILVQLNFVDRQQNTIYEKGIVSIYKYFDNEKVLLEELMIVNGVASCFLKKKFDNHRVIIEVEVKNYDKLIAKDITIKTKGKSLFTKEFRLKYNNFLFGVSIFCFEKDIDTLTNSHIQVLNRKYKSQINKYFLHKKNHYVIGEFDDVQKAIVFLKRISPKDRSSSQIMCIKKDKPSGSDVILPLLYKVQIAELSKNMKREKRYKISGLISENLIEEIENIDSGKSLYRYITSSSYLNYEAAQERREEIIEILEIKDKNEYPFLLFYLEEFKKMNIFLNN